MLFCQHVEFGCSLADTRVAVLVHILGFNNLFCPILAQGLEKTVQLGNTASAAGGGKGSSHQDMGNVCLECPLRHIHHAGTRVSNKMNWTARRNSHRLIGGCEPDVLGTDLIRRVALIPERAVQTDLKPLD